MNEWTEDALAKAYSSNPDLANANKNASGRARDAVDRPTSLTVREWAREPPGRAKYGNQRTEYNGRIFDSKKEAAQAQTHDLELAAGELSWYLCQVSFGLPAGIRYVADFVCGYPSGCIVVEDVKSKATKTQVYRLKRKLFEATYEMRIREV